MRAFALAGILGEINDDFAVAVQAVDDIFREHGGRQETENQDQQSLFHVFDSFWSDQ